MRTPVHASRLAAEWLPIAVSLVASTAATLAVTGRLDRSTGGSLLRAEPGRIADFLEEILRHLIDEGKLVRDGGDWRARLPPRQLRHPANWAPAP